jgi:SAM-dependent methyltransferase
MNKRLYKALRQINRFVCPYFDIKNFWQALRATPWYWSQLISYRSLTHEIVPLWELRPALKDRFASAGNLDAHYFRQDLWVASRIISTRPPVHVDVGSRFDGFVAQLSLVVPVEMVDIRPLNHGLDTVRFRQGNICSLPYPDRSVASLSSLHVLEHIGLGRYGDPLDPKGSEKALQELMRVLAPGGVLYVSVPIGRARVCFNAHRVFDPEFVIGQLSELTLVEFIGIDDHGRFLEGVDPVTLRSADFGLGIYEFNRPAV